MNRATSKKLAFNNKTTTYGNLVTILENAVLDGQSKINKSLSKKQVHEIMIGALDSEDKSAIINTTRLNKRDKIALSSHGMIMANILFEFG